MKSLPYLVLLIFVTSLDHAPAWAGGTGNRGAPVFDFDCASATQFPAAALHKIVQAALTETKRAGIAWGDRAVTQDLNGDGRPEYFVPLHCGATGNCTWGVFGTLPTRRLGTVEGGRLQVLYPAAGWAKVVGYSSLGAGQGLKQVFELRVRQYVEIERTEVAGPENDRVLGSMGDPKCEPN